MRVHIPHFFRIETFPGRPYQFMPRDRRWQADAAGIPDALLRPITPGSKRCGAGERGAAKNKIASFQLRKKIRPASS